MGSQARVLFYLDNEFCRVPVACRPGELERLLRAVYGEPVSAPPRAGTLPALGVQFFRV
jgi:hypothetical protein